MSGRDMVRRCIEIKKRLNEKAVVGSTSCKSDELHVNLRKKSDEQEVDRANGSQCNKIPDELQLSHDDADLNEISGQQQAHADQSDVRILAFVNALQTVNASYTDMQISNEKATSKPIWHV